MLPSELDPAPLIEDVRASRGEGPDDAGLVVVEGVWGAVTGGPPPVLLIDDGERRHTIAALPGTPPDDPMSFRATFAVPAELLGGLGEGLALGIGRTEVPLTVSEPALPVAESPGGSWLQGPPVIARRLGEDVPEGDEPVAGFPNRPGRRFERGGGGAAAAASATPQEGIAAAILRATTPAPRPGATVVERSVIAERRARRSEQVAAVMERRARGAEQSAQELGQEIQALEERLQAVLAERDRLLARLETQEALTAQAQAAREEAETRLAELVAEHEAAPAAEGSGVALQLPGLEEAARALNGHEPARPAAADEPAEGPDPFADALAKLRAGGDLVAVAAARVAEEPVAAVVEEPSPREELAAVVAAARPRTVARVAPPFPEQVIPYVIAAEHPRTRWLAEAIATLDGRDRASAARIVAVLLADGARTSRRPLVYDLDLEGVGPLRVELEARGQGTVRERSGASPDAAFSLVATPAEMATLAAGGAPLFPRGLRAGGARRFFLPLTRLSRARRKPLALADIVGAGIDLEPGLAVRALASAVPPGWTMGHAFAVTVSVPGHDTCRVHARDGRPLHVLHVDEAGRRSVVARTAPAGPERPEGAVGGADAVIGVPGEGALPLLAQTEPPAEAEPATVLGDLGAATTLLSWFDRVQGLKPRA